ncbi:uncharacterized protein LOC129328565 isoform X2 [Eublepharis macularius]|uniref:Uncharacterized protein LOC129328565 isoform X2 n=1 Tax=Eublepharis macularius TaxID=481883 RepID=A0AA97J8G5_EUBMA|nr:uncharacterized protein LOC129328565 isoform X2 [Eublepharis macularius]
MAGLCLFWILVGPTAALQVILPESSVYISAGNTALLSASLNFSPPVPNYFQLRWRFVTGSWLVLKLKANNCMAKNGTQHWRDSCVISIEATERYRQRAKLSSNDASLVLQDVRTEDSGIYSVTVLALDMTSSATISLAVTKVDPDIPVSFVKAADDGGYTLSNSIQLGLAGLILCLLGLIIAEAQFSIYISADIEHLIFDISTTKLRTIVLLMVEVEKASTALQRQREREREM